MPLAKETNDQELLNSLLGKDAEIRSQQLTLIEGIRDVIKNQYQVLIAEAPPGTGKSLSYLIPIAEYLLYRRTHKDLNSDKKNIRECAVISTYTKTLQKQLIEKDIPLINEYLRRNNIKELSCMAFYGSENYICLRRFFKIENDFKENKATPEEKEVFDAAKVAKIAQWLSYTKAGLHEEITGSCSLKEWSHINRQTELCLGDECGYWGGCHYFKAKYRLHRETDIAAVNHHLYMRNLQANNKLLPRDYKISVIDEVHTAPDVARENMGSELSNKQVNHLLTRMYSKNGGYLRKFIKNNRPSDDIKECVNLCEDVKISGAEYFNKLKELAFQDSSYTLRIKKETVIPETELPSDFKKLALMIEDIVKDIPTDDDTRLEGEGLIKHLDEYRKVLTGFLERESDEYVYWIEVEGKKDKNQRDERVSIKYMYSEIGEKLKNMMFKDPQKTTILVSATVSISRHGGFEFFKKEMGTSYHGTNIVKELTLDSPFDYKKQILVYMPKISIAPDMPGYQRFLADEIMTMYRMNFKIGGGTFSLFRSFKTMYEVEATGKSVYGPEFNPMIQGGGLSNQEMIDTMKTKEGAFGFGVCSFWQGVDLPGKNLSVLIITRLPFSVPDNPIYAARAEKLKEEKRSPFKEIAIPQAILWFRQGVGRLIRTKDDMGIICILDSRIIDKPYGKGFMWYLDGCERTNDHGRAENFLNSIKWKQRN